MKEDQNIILKLNGWRIVSDEVAAFAINKVLDTGLYRITVVLKTGYEIEEDVIKSEAISFGETYIRRVEELYEQVD